MLRHDLQSGESDKLHLEDALFEPIFYQPIQPVEIHPAKRLFAGIPPLVTSEDHLLTEEEMQTKLLVASYVVRKISTQRDSGYFPKTIHVIRGRGGKNGVPILYTSILSTQEKGENDLSILVEFEGKEEQMIINDNSIHTIYYLCRTFNIGIHPKSVDDFAKLFGNLVSGNTVPIKPCYSSPEFDKDEFMKTYILGSVLSLKEINSLFNKDGFKEFLPTDIAGSLTVLSANLVRPGTIGITRKTIHYYANGTPVNESEIPFTEDPSQSY